MQALRQMGGGVAIAIISLLLVIGGISLSLAENTPTPVDNTPTPILSTPLVLDLPTFTPLPTDTLALDVPTNTPIVQPSNTPLPPPVVCTPPSGWFQISVNANDTLYTIAERYKTSPEMLSSSNCLTSANILPAFLYVPPVPTVTVIPCGPPAGWVKIHTVQAGDNLYRIALSYGLTYPQLQRANCMGSSIAIYAGQLLWVPNIPTLTPVPGVTIIPNFPTQTPSTTPLPSATFAPPIETSTFISTSSPVPPTLTPTSTTAPAPTSTPSITPFPTQ